MRWTLWTVGYGRWPAARRAEALVDELRELGVTRLVDVRLAPCASSLTVGHPYGPKPWNLQGKGQGIVELSSSGGIVYEWLVELGNPQRQDPSQAILKEQIADPGGGWPVHRGLERLAGRVREPGAVVAILCACPKAADCHRSTIAEALRERHFAGELGIREVGERD